MGPYIRFACSNPACGTRLKAKHDQAGKRARCACGHGTVVPAPRPEPEFDPLPLPLNPIPARNHRSPEPLPLPDEDAPAPPRRRWPWVAGAGAAALLALGLGAWLLTRTASRPASPLPDDQSPVAAASPAPSAVPTPTPARPVEPPPTKPAGPKPPEPKPVPKEPPPVAPPPRPAPPSVAIAPPPREVPVRDPAAPQLTASVRWKFREGASGASVTLHNWKTTASIAPTDTRTWTVVPDLVVGEAAGFETLAQACCGLANTRARPALFGSPTGGTLPTDTSGKAWVGLVIGNQIVGQKVDRSWRLNGKDVLWRPAPLTRGDQLECVWEHASDVSFNGPTKARADYRPFHLGPLVYDAMNPAGPCYALAALGERVPGGRDEWACENPELIPLTAEGIREEIMNSDRPDDWRMQFVVWYWSQPRPVKDAEDVLLRELKDEECPEVVRLAAALNLLKLGYKPAVPALAALAADKGAGDTARARFIAAPGAHWTVGLTSLAAIARDADDERSVREAALAALMKHGESGRAVVRKLTDDPAIGTKARQLLADANKK